VRMRSIPQSVSNRLAPYRASFKSAPAQRFNIWCWLLVTIIIASSGQVKTLTRYMPTRVAYWTTLRMIRTKVWNEQALLDLMVADILYSLPPPKDGVLHLIFGIPSANRPWTQPFSHRSNLPAAVRPDRFGKCA
jgi:hypothetical protein